MNKDRTERQRKGLANRLLALVLSIALVVGMLPTTLAAAPTSGTLGVRETDTATISDWQKLYVEDTTFDAGAVWTDKSVFADVLPEEFKNVVNVEGKKIEMVDPDNNFLVALSAMASNKEIVGYSTTPTDTIIILDLSQSMDNSASIPQTISSANTAIQRLLDLNKNNRVGVVLYSGNSNWGVAGTNTGKVLLGLNRYTPSGSNNYLTYTGDSDETRVNIAQGLKIEGSSSAINRNNTEKTTVGGTYIQNGLDLAMDEFLKADPTIEDKNVQGGETRMPIFVLMSDGAPTSGTYNYTNIGNSTVGNGGDSSAGLGFMTQLTAAYALNQVEDHYNKDVSDEEKIDAKFYTLGLNLSQQDSDGQYVANSVLNPSASLAAINDYWDALFPENATGNESVRFRSPGTSNRQDNDEIWVTVRRDQNDGLGREDQNYVDEYFEADSNADLNAAFSAIVNEIIIQSAYYPTLVDSGNHDLDGYITFEDELGYLMEVKNITGLMLGDNYLYTGEALAKMMGTDEFGDRYTYTELGWELVGTVAERIGVSQDVAIEILKAAWADGQLSYSETADGQIESYSNYIGWYEGEDGSYKGYWNEEHTAEDKPTDAKYISRSYGFYGTERDNSIEALKSDMMHIIVKVRTEIATGHQDVVFQIPASLVPVITYHIELDADNFEDAENITLELEDGVRPIRLLFEVGLRSDVNELTVADLMEGSVQDNFDEDTGKYYFYTNQSDSADSYNGILNMTHDEMYEKLKKDLVTESHFHPSTENERYYYTDDIVVFADQNGTKYNGTTSPSVAGGTYYHAIREFKRTGNGNAAEMVMRYVEIAPETLQGAEQADDGSWYIEAGTIYQLIGTDYYLKKSKNETNTFPYVDLPVVHGFDEGESLDTYDIYDFLGNNGRIGITPATGIKLTKQVDDTITDADATFGFVVELSSAEDATYTYYAPDGTKGTIIFEAGSAEISLKAGETVYITGLPAGATYTVSEKAHADYKVDSVSVDGSVVADVTASGTIVEHKVTDVEFTNTVRGEGSLTVRKTVTHDFGSDYVIPSKEFDITVKLVDALGNAFAQGTEVTTSAGVKSVGADGEISFKLAHDQTITITGLTEGTDYIVKENLPENSGFTLTGEDVTRTGEISADQTKTVELVNDYNPEVPTINIDVTKEVQYEGGAPITTDWSYNFVLEVLENNEWKSVKDSSGAEITATAEASTPGAEMAIPKEYLDVVGTYYFRIRETNPGEGLASDTSRYFSVRVSDNDMDGTVEVEVISVQNGSASDNDIDMTFTNEYLVEGSVAVEIPIDKDLTNATGVDIPYNSFSFMLKDSDGEEVGTYYTDAHGDATIHLTYDNQDFLEAVDGENATFVYTLEENKPEKAGMKYSNEVYKIEVVLVGDNGTLRLESKTITNSNNVVVENAKFINEFTLNPVPLALSGTKNLTGRDIKAGEFEFGLYKTDSDFVIDAEATLEDSDENTVESANVGKFSFEDSINTAGVHYYVVKEISTTPKANVTYDSAVYHVTVVVVDGGNGALAITNMNIVKSGSRATSEEAIVFNNVYTPTPIGVTIEGQKEFTGGTLTSGMFEFVLTGEGVNETVGNVGNKFTFSEIEYTKAGTYKYTVKEKVPNPVPKGYTYDDSNFEVTVVVKDNDVTGKLEIESIVYTENDGTDAEGVDNTIIFRNVYDPEDAKINLTAHKLLENRDLEDGEFTFEVYKADENFEILAPGDPLKTATNGAEYIENEEQKYDVKLVEFDTFTIDAPGTYYYVIKEAKGNDVDVTYDTTEYQVTIIVYDWGGQLSSRVTYALNGQPIDDVVFSNVYTPPVEKDVFAEGNSEISMDGKVVTAGDVLTYEITYTNKSDKDSADVTITDTIPAGTTYKENSATGNAGYDETTRTLTWTMKDVAPNSSITVYFDVIVDVTDVDIENTAYAKIGENTHESNTVYNYTYNKEVNKTTAKLGEELEYTIDYANLTGVQAEVVIVDKLDDGLTYVEGSATKDGVYDSETHTITWTFKSEIGEAGEVSFKAVINENAVEVIDNVATVQVENEAVVETNEVETVLSNPSVSIKKTQAVNVKAGETVDATDKKLKVEAGDVVTYYLTVKNAKGAGTAHKLEITDMIPTGLELQYIDGEPVISGGGEVDSDGVIIWTVDKLAANEEVTLSFNVIVPDVEKETTWTNVAYVVYDDPDNPGKTPTESNEVKIVEDVADLTVSKVQEVNSNKASAKVQKVEAGDVVTYSITVSNAEDAGMATNVVVTDKIPAGLTLVKDSISNSGEVADGVIKWTIETLEAGESITVSFKVTVPDVTKDTTWKNVATVVHGDSDEPEESNEVVIEEGTPKLVISKYQRVNLGSASDKKLNAKAGDKIVYSIVVTNNGTEAAKGVTISDKIPAGLTLVENAISEGGKVANGVITWTIDEVAVGQSIVVHFAVTVPAVEKDTEYKNIATVVYDNNYEGPDVPQDSNEVTFTNEKAAPQTGDSSSTVMWTSLAFGSLMVCAVLLINNKKRNEEA